MSESNISCLPGGLYNIGNTCYANVIFQVLCHAPGLMDFLDSFCCNIKFLDDMRSALKMRLIFGEKNVTQLPITLNFIYSMWKVFAQLRVHKKNARPKRLLLHIQEQNAEFTLSQQHDAQELLMVMLHVMLEAPDIACKYRDTLLLHARQMLHENGSRKEDLSTLYIYANDVDSVDYDPLITVVHTKSITTNDSSILLDTLKSTEAAATYSTISVESMCSQSKNSLINDENKKALKLKSSKTFSASETASFKVRRMAKTVILSDDHSQTLRGRRIDREEVIGVKRLSKESCSSACSPIKRTPVHSVNPWRKCHEDKAWETTLLAHHRMQKLKSLDVEDVNPMQSDSEAFRLRGGARTLSLSRRAQQPQKISSCNPFYVKVPDSQILRDNSNMENETNEKTACVPITLSEVVCRLSALSLSKNTASLKPYVGMNDLRPECFNYIAEHFQGKLRYKTQCFDCMEETVTWQPYNVISCPVPSSLAPSNLSLCDNDPCDLELKHDMFLSVATTASTTQAANAHDPLQTMKECDALSCADFTQTAQCNRSIGNEAVVWPQCALREVEMLCGDDRFECSTCRHSCEAYRVQEYVVTPTLLAFHLKRFAVNAMSGFVEKDTRPVDIPLELTLKEFESGHDLRYVLYALVIHQGFTISSGHYTCYLNLDAGSGKPPLGSCWICCDDEQVELLDLAQLICVTQSVELSDKTPYLVFYSRATNDAI